MRAERGAEPLKIDEDAVAAASTKLNSWECFDAENVKVDDIKLAASCKAKEKRRLEEEVDCAENVWTNANYLKDPTSTTIDAAVQAWYE